MPSWVGPWEIFVFLVLLAIAAGIVITVVAVTRPHAPRTSYPQPLGRNYPTGSPSASGRGLVCEACGVTLPPNSAFCNMCATPVVRASTTPASSGAPGLLCVKCGSQTRQGDQFCHACGEPVAGAAPAADGNPPAHEDGATP
jgi:predicted amidophosphoribosyltransferase